jgi:hypothetical protein
MEIASKRRWIISSGDGYFPIWIRDGKRILFSTGSGEHTVDVRTSPDFSAGDPVFAFDVTEKVQDVTPDGSHVLAALDVIDDDQTETRPRVTVDLNWFKKIEERIGSR